MRPNLQTRPPPQSSVSPVDSLTTAKNSVAATQTVAQNLLNISGATNSCGIGTATVVKTTAGRIARLSVIMAGSSPGVMYDANVTNDTSKPLAALPNTVGVTEINLPFNFGLMIIPGTGQVVTVSYS